MRVEPIEATEGPGLDPRGRGPRVPRPPGGKRAEGFREQMEAAIRRDLAMNMKTENLERAEKARVALHAYGGGVDDEANLRDLLADLRHYCDREGLDFAREDRTAYGHYSAEVAS